MRRGPRFSRRMGGSSLPNPLAFGPVAAYTADVGISLNGSDVSAWADQVGSANATQGLVAALQPAYGTDSHGEYLLFAGSEYLEANGLVAFVGGTGVNLSIVTSYTDEGAAGDTYLVAGGNTGTNVPLHLHEMSATGVRVVRRLDTNSFATETDVEITKRSADCVISTFESGATAIYGLDGSHLSAVGNTGAVTLDTVTIGALVRAVVSGETSCRLRSVYIFDRALKVSEVASIQAYEQRRWNL